MLVLTRRNLKVDENTVTSLLSYIMVSHRQSVVDLVSELLAVCSRHRIELQFQNDTCIVRSLDSAWQSSIVLFIPKSAFRAVIARISVLCNEYAPNSVSPYGGEGVLRVSPEAIIKAAFVNTAANQQLTLTTVRTVAENADPQQILIADGITLTITIVSADRVRIGIGGPNVRSIISNEETSDEIATPF